MNVKNTIFIEKIQSLVHNWTHMHFANTHALMWKPCFRLLFVKTFLILRPSLAKAEIAHTSRASLQSTFIRLLLKVVEVFCRSWFYHHWNRHTVCRMHYAAYSMQYTRLHSQTGFDKILMWYSIFFRFSLIWNGDGKTGQDDRNRKE